MAGIHGNSQITHLDIQISCHQQDFLSLSKQIFDKLKKPQLVCFTPTTQRSAVNQLYRLILRPDLFNYQWIGKYKTWLVAQRCWFYPKCSNHLSYNIKKLKFNSMNCRQQVTAATLPTLYLTQSLCSQTETPTSGLMDRIASVWEQYKTKKPIRAMLMGFFGMPPTSGDDLAVTAKFFIDAKEGY